jgi:hypothetical protein
MSFVRGQINVEVLFTVLADFTAGYLSFMDVKTPDNVCFLYRKCK